MEPAAVKTELNKLLDRYQDGADSPWRREQAERFRKEAALLPDKSRLARECADLLARLEEHSRVLGVAPMWAAAAAAIWCEGGDDVIAAILEDNDNLAVGESMEEDEAILGAAWAINKKTIALYLATARAIDAVDFDDPWLLIEALSHERDGVASARASRSAKMNLHQPDPLRLLFVAALRAQRENDRTLKQALEALCADRYEGLHTAYLRDKNKYRAEDENATGNKAAVKEWTCAAIKSMWAEAATPAQSAT